MLQEHAICVCVLGVGALLASRTFGSNHRLLVYRLDRPIGIYPY